MSYNKVKVVLASVLVEFNSDRNAKLSTKILIVNENSFAFIPMVFLVKDEKVYFCLKTMFNCVLLKYLLFVFCFFVSTSKYFDNIQLLA